MLLSLPALYSSGIIPRRAGVVNRGREIFNGSELGIGNWELELAAAARYCGGMEGLGGCRGSARWAAGWGRADERPLPRRGRSLCSGNHRRPCPFPEGRDGD